MNGKTVKSNPAVTAMPVLIALSLAHFLNDLLQTTVNSAYPIIKDDLDLSFAQIGSITFVYQIAASVFQPLVGMVFDKRPFKGSMLLATTFTMLGIICLALAPNLAGIYIAVFTIGVGSSIIHPEASPRASPRSRRAGSAGLRSPSSRWEAISAEPSVRSSSR